MTGLTEALRRQAVHERRRGRSWRQVARWHGPIAYTWSAEYEARADLYDEWAQALELGVSVDWIRYGCDRARLA